MDAAPLTPVRVEPGEELEFARCVGSNFHDDGSDEDNARWAERIASHGTYRAWLVRDAGTAVANYGIFTMDISVPGGARVPMAGVTAVGVAQTHRRRGVLTAMMQAGLDDAVERGEPVAGLYASESPIYGRFGFGVTAPSVAHRIDRGVAFHERCDPRMVLPAAKEEALASWPAILEAARGVRAGGTLRDDHMWRHLIEQDPAGWREGFSARRRVHVPGRGYALYRAKEGFADALPDGEVRVLELVATDPEAEAALWQHVCDIDLTSKVTAWYRPPDDPLLTLVVDPLRARTHVGPPLYTRLLDVARAFAARTYATSGTCTFAVVDPTRDQSGTYRLDAGPDGAEVARVDADPELTVPIDVAASVWLGGLRATHLLAGRRLQEHVPGAAARLDRLAATERAPWSVFEF